MFSFFSLPYFEMHLCYCRLKEVHLPTCIQAQRKHKQEFVAKKVKVYLSSWCQLQRHRWAIALKILAPRWPLVVRLHKGKIIHHGYCGN